jgi:HPt (histidine-containing phosphotransfer) domain-containing protein
MVTDLSYLETMSDKDMAFIEEMINIFRDQIDEYSREMPLLLGKADFVNLARMAHKAKTSVAVMGMTRDAELLKRLEIKAADGIDTHSYKDLIDTFIERSSLALAELDIYLKSNKP